MTRRVLFSDSLMFWGGGENLFLLLARELSARGWEPVIAGRPGSEIVRRAQDSGIAIQTWTYRHDLDPGTISGSTRFMRGHPPVAVVLTTGRDVRTVGVAARLLGVPTVWAMGVPLPNRGLAHRLSGRYLVDQIIVPSRHLESELGRFRFLAGKIAVIPNGIPECDFAGPERIESCRASLGWEKSRFTVLYVGRLLERKGVDVLIAAIALAAHTNPTVRLVVVGAGPAEQHLRDHAARLGVEAQVTFAGFADDPGLYLDACDLVVVPSRWEPFGFVLLEAMVRGKPVVASRVGGIPEVAGDAAFLVPPDHPEALSAAILRMMDSPELRQRTGHAGRVRVLEHFTSARMAERYEQAFAALASSPRPQHAEGGHAS